MVPSQTRVALPQLSFKGKVWGASLMTPARQPFEVKEEGAGRRFVQPG